MYTLTLPTGLEVPVEVEETPIMAPNEPNRSSKWKPVTLTFNAVDEDTHQQVFLWMCQNYCKMKPISVEAVNKIVRLRDESNEWEMRGAWVGWFQINKNLQLKMRLKFETITEGAI